MDAPSNTKSGGLRFAEQHMQRHGWSEGKGLGKREDGISEAIKVKVKCDTAGVGHNSAEQFTFHWWDHVFNKTASSISVEPDQDGVKVKKLSEEAAPVSSKKPRKAMLSRDMLYGRFIKSATLTSGGEKPVQDSSSSDTSDSSDDEDSKLDLSSAAKLSDETLMKVCGGRTAHKGARHGLTMSAKLSRIEEQEREFMEKYGKKEIKQQPLEEFNGNDKKMSTRIRQKEGNVAGEEQDGPSKVPKKKKKRRKEDREELEEDAPNGHEHIPSMEEDAVTPIRKRSKASDNTDMADETEVVDDHKNDLSVEDEDTRRAKKKKNKRRKEEREELEEDAPNGHGQEHVPSMEEDAVTWRKKRSKVPDNTNMVLGDHKNDLSVEEDTRRAKKKEKRKTEREESVMSNGYIDNGVHQGHSRDEEEEHEKTGEEVGTSKKKKKKERRAEVSEELAEAEEQSRNHNESTVEEENGERTKRKKKKREDNDEPEDGEDYKATKKKKKSKSRD
ncbi:G patch domain-containing protein 4 [Hyla sarda]|uniref:G patch domain-containing protein 4 n=1 Tax=Hyla sarda TaxID=327740 RepID=UPI0024C236FC|nr:G patch domain-containing protein 4 [Hyla sarda]XP_056402594.1 G patch domain-containing protein 4 [Hyla sarda]